MVTYYFKEPAPYPIDLTIAVPDVSYQPDKHLGAWQCVAPEEMKHAFVRAIARDIDRKAAPPVLARWRDAALSCTGEFKVLTSDDDIFFAAFNARERVAADYAGLSRTAYQRIFEIITFRARRAATMGAAMGPKALAQAFNEHARLSSKSEEVSGEYIAAALNVHDKALKLPAVREAFPCQTKQLPKTTTDDSFVAAVCWTSKTTNESAVLRQPAAQAIEALEGRCGVDSPFNSVHKLNVIVKRSRDNAQITWCFWSVADKVISGTPTADFSLRGLCGDSSSGNKGQVDVFLFRLTMIHHLGHVLLERLEPSPQIRQKYWELFVSHAAYRANLTPYNPEHKVDLSWKAGWPRSMISFFAWAEDMIFKDDYYTQLRTATRHSKGALDFMEYDTVAFKWAGILDMYTAEQDAAKKAIAATAEPEAALCAAGAADASALARPTSSGNEDAGAADDTAAKREATRTGERGHHRRARQRR